MSSVIGGIYFLVRVIFFLIVLVLMLRLLFPVFKVDRQNPFVQAILSITKGFVAAAQGVFPVINHVDMGTLVVILVLTMLKIFLLQVFSFSGVDLVWLPISAVFDAARVVLDIFFFSIIVMVIYSFFPSPQLGQLAAVANRFAQPILTPIQKIMPNTGAFDFSPIVAMIGIKLVDIVFLSPFVY